MRFAFVADVHLGNHRLHGGRLQGGLNDRARLIARVLARAVLRTHDLGACFIVCGDLFDVAYPSPPLVAAAMESLGREAYVLRGNHDVSSASGVDDALAPLDHAQGHLRVLREPVALHGEVELGMIPYMPGKPARHLVPAAIRTLGCPVVAIHAGVIDAHTPAFLRDAESAVPVEELFAAMKDAGTRLVVAGDWHEHRVWRDGDRTVVQVGALVPTGWDNPGESLYGRIVLCDTDTWEITAETIPGPRFLTVPFALAGPTLDALDPANLYFVRIRCAPGEIAAAKALAEGYAQGPWFAAVDVVPLVEEVSAAAKEAAARAAEVSLPAAVAEFVSTMPLPEGVDRDAVRTLALELLA